MGSPPHFAHATSLDLIGARAFGEVPPEPQFPRLCEPGAPIFRGRILPEHQSTGPDFSGKNVKI